VNFKKLKIQTTCLIGFLFHEKCVHFYAESELSPIEQNELTYLFQKMILPFEYIIPMFLYTVKDKIINVIIKVKIIV